MKQPGRPLIRRGYRKNSPGQATTELAIMGAIVIMILAQLLQQGYLYNCKQALEMYTFRQALKLSRDGVYNPSMGKKLPVGINLTVIRDIFVPSFFSGLNRQTLQATASVEYNPYILYVPDEESGGQDMPSRQLIQVNDAMIRKGYFIEVPPTLLAVKDKNAKEAPEYTWVDSSIDELDFEGSRDSVYEYITKVKEVKGIGKTTQRTLEKKLTSKDTSYGIISFNDAEKIKENYQEGDKDVEVLIKEETIPRQLNFILREEVKREKTDVAKIGD